MPTTVVNVKNALRGTYRYCGRPTIFGNPYRLGKDGDRREVIIKFIDYFFDRLGRDKWFKSKIEELRGQTLGCYCLPLPCHCSVIATYLNETEPISGSVK